MRPGVKVNHGRERARISPFGRIWAGVRARRSAGAACLIHKNNVLAGNQPVVRHFRDCDRALSLSNRDLRAARLPGESRPAPQPGGALPPSLPGTPPRHSGAGRRHEPGTHSVTSRLRHGSRIGRCPSGMTLSICVSSSVIPGRTIVRTRNPFRDADGAAWVPDKASPFRDDGVLICQRCGMGPGSRADAPVRDDVFLMPTPACNHKLPGGGARGGGPVRPG